MDVSVSDALLARTGFLDAARARRIVDGSWVRTLIEQDEAVLSSIGASADPDQALLLLERWLEACAEADRHRYERILLADSDARGRLVDIFGMSEALGDFLVRHPPRWECLIDAEGLAQAPQGQVVRAALLEAVGADAAAAQPIAANDGAETLDALRVAYRQQLLGIAARDLAGLAEMEAVASWLADLADAVLEAALAIARAGLDESATQCTLAIIGMGKCGGRELNYVSDVDVIFVAEAEHADDEPAMLRTATALATGVMRACNAVTAEGAIWEVDPNLRPEGKQGALVRTIASHVGYYERWAQTWEFQALLKARHVAGDRDLGGRYVDAVSPFVWSAADHPTFVDDVQAMRRRVEQHIPARVGIRELKLAPGGLRDVEFSVQLLQLVHGRSDVMLRSSNTLAALEALALWGYVGREDAATLTAAYRFLRTLEHRIQLYRLRRTHTMPEAEADLRRLGRSMGFRSRPVEDLVAEWQRHAREVRRIHEKLFYRPLLNAVARLGAGEARLTPEAAEERLHALGYVDPAGALRHLEALTSGVSRRASIQRTLLPVLLGWFADAPDPDAGLLGFRRVSDALGSTHWYLRLLRDESAAAERLAQVLGSSRYATELLLHGPESVNLLADESELQPRSLEALCTEALAAASRHDDPQAAVASVRWLRRRELFRIAAAEVLREAEPDRAAASLSDVARATIVGALEVAMKAASAERGSDLPIEFAVIAMGRLGGAELGFSSDADVMFVYEAHEGADEREANAAAHAVATDLRARLMAPSADPPLEIDAGLRPEGKQGPLVRSFESYQAYYERWSAPWESQALLRASFAAGSQSLGDRFMAMIDALRYPADGISDADVREMRRLKARMESERLPRGADPTLHTKLGRGGLSDVEWVAQLIQMRHAHEVSSLRTTRTLEALQAAVIAGLLSASDEQALSAAWRLATGVRNAVMLVRGTAADQIPADPKERAGVAHILGYAPGESERLLDDYRRVTRRARKVVERVFFGADD